ncbi:MAG: ABC transporter ATP-binding protein [Acholeplasmataceae bacterium]|nr:ABC transporter ATP-binding protein [Acholeplasmataceae bacterium]
MIRLENVSKYYRSLSSVGVGIRRVTLELSRGEFIVVTGPSGSGKSTLLNVISGLDTYEEGEILINGEETSHFTVDDWESYRASQIGFVFQDYNVIDALSVLENVLVALELKGFDKVTAKEKARLLIDKVGLTNRLHHRAGKLSGGEKQRTVIARALAKDSPVIVCDEPTGNLDSASGKDIMALLGEVSKDRLVVVVTHSEEDVMPYATRKIRMRDGQVIEDIVMKDVRKEHDWESFIVPKMTFGTLMRQSVRHLFRTPKKLFFMVSLQVFAVALLVFVYAFLMASSDTLIGENAAQSDSSHQMRIVRKDMEPVDASYFESLGPVQDIGLYPTAYEAFVAFSLPGERDPLSNFPLGEIRMENAAVLDDQDLVAGDLPTLGQVVLSDVMLELYGLSVGDEILLFDRYMRFDNSVGMRFEIAGTTIRGTKETVYFNPGIFTNQAIALKGLIQVYGKVPYHYTMEDGALVANTFGAGQIVFSDQLLTGTVEVPVHLLPDPMETPVYAFDFVFGPYYGQSHLFHVEADDVNLSAAMHSNIIMSKSFEDDLIDAFLGEQYQTNDIIVNVRDLTDGRLLSGMLDHQVYRVFYDVNAASTSARIMSDREFRTLAYAVVLGLGLAVFAVLGGVMKSVNVDRRKDFSVMRAIGAHRQDLAVSVMIGTIVTSVIAYALTLLIALLAITFSYEVRLAMRHVDITSYGWLFVIVMMLSVWIAARQNRKFFGYSVITALNQNGDDAL